MGNSQSHRLGIPSKVSSSSSPSKQKSFQSGRAASPTLYQLLFGACHKNQMVVDNDLFNMDSDVFFGATASDELTDDSMQVIGDQLQQTVACSCLCSSCQDQMLIS